MNKFNVTFVGQFVLNENDFDKYSRAGNNYQKKVLKFVNPECRISIFPYFYKIYNESSLDNYFFYSKKIINGHGLYFLKALVWGLRKGLVDTSKNILYYNFTPYYLGFYIGSFLKRKRQYFIIADYWQKNDYMQNVQNFIVGKSHGVLALNENIRINSNSQYLCGLIDKDEVIIIKNKSNRKLKFLFSGSIGYETGFDLCLNFFKNNPNYELFISGFLYGDLANDWERFQIIIDNSVNINYVGQLSKLDYIDLLNNSDVCFSLRNPHDEQHDYNFPSKILEYLSNGKFVISSKEYAGLSSSLFYKTEFTLESLKSTICRIIDHSVEFNDDTKKYYQDRLIEDFGNKKLRTLLKELMK